jgi:WD40 repeat protein
MSVSVEEKSQTKPWLVGIFVLLLIFSAILFFWVRLSGTTNELRAIAQIQPDSDPITAFAVSQDGGALARGAEHMIQVFRMSTNSLRWSTQTPNAVRALAFSPDGRMLAVGGRSSIVMLWKPENGSDLTPLPDNQDDSDYPGDVLCLRFSYDGSWLAAGMRNGAIKLWKLDSNDIWNLAKGEEKGKDVLAIDFSENNRWLVSGGQADAVVLWDLMKIVDDEQEEAPQYFQRIGSGTVTSVAVSNDGSLLAAGTQDSRGRVLLWKRTGNDPRRLPSVAALMGHNGPVKALQFSPGSSILASASPDPCVIFWQTQTGRKIQQLTAPKAASAFMAFARTRQLLLASASLEGELHAWSSPMPTEVSSP